MNKKTINWLKLTAAITVPVAAVSGVSVGIVAGTVGFSKNDSNVQITTSTSAANFADLSQNELLSSINRDLNMLIHDSCYFQIFYFNNSWRVSIYNSSNVQTRKSILSFGTDDFSTIDSTLLNKIKSETSFIPPQNQGYWKNIFEKIDIYVGIIRDTIERNKRDFDTKYKNVDLESFDEKQLLEYISNLLKSTTYLGGTLESISYQRSELVLNGKDEMSMKYLSIFNDKDLVDVVNKYAQKFLTPPPPKTIFYKADAKEVSALPAGQDKDKIYIDSKEYTYYSSTPYSEYVDSSQAPHAWPASWNIHSLSDLSKMKFWHFKEGDEYFSKIGDFMNKHVSVDQDQYISKYKVDKDVTLPDTIQKTEDFYSGEENFDLNIQVYASAEERAAARSTNSPIKTFHYKDSKVEIYSTTKDPIVAYLFCLEQPGGSASVVHEQLPFVVEGLGRENAAKAIIVDGATLYWHTAKLINPGFFSEVPNGNSVPDAPEEIKYLLGTDQYFTSEETLSQFLVKQYSSN